MSRYFAVVAYDGHPFYGFQKQPNQVTIQGEIEKVLSQLLNQKMSIFGSGRTDAGVHAHGQTFHFDVDRDLELDAFRYRMNCLLPKTIHILSLERKEETFHARLSAKKKVYMYRLNMQESNPFEIHYCYQFLRKLDVKSMQTAASMLVGEHCFHNFTSKEEDEFEFVRHIYDIRIEEKDGILSFWFEGNGFMRYMIRMLVGTLIEVGLHRIEPEFVKEKLEEKERHIVSYKAPAEGLYLEKVVYDDEM